MVLFENLTRKQADICHLVIRSQEIACRIALKNGCFCIHVPESHADVARHAVEAYLAENPPLPAADRGSGGRFPAASLNLSGVAVALMMMAVYAAMTTSGDPMAYVAAFGAKARMITAGEGYRCVTALLLHADAAHLAGNMAGLIFLGGVVCAMTGAGVGWLMILICGAAGNAITAVAHTHGTNPASDHLSIGASTAVFAALGILSAMRSIDGIRSGKGWRQVVLCLGAGAALLGLMGTSARSDIGAHLFGYLAGVGLGSAYTWRIRFRPGLWIQVLAGGVAAITVLVSWLAGAAFF